MRTLFYATPTPGHLRPLPPLARAARGHGDDLAFLTGAGVTPIVAARAGIVVEPASVTSRSIGSAVDRARVDPPLRSGPQAVAREIAEMPSAEDVIARLANRLVEAA